MAEAVSDFKEGPQHGIEMVELGPVTCARRISHVTFCEVPEKKVDKPQSTSFSSKKGCGQEGESEPVTISRSVDKRKGSSVSAVHERRWSVSIACIVATIPAFLIGVTVGYPSSTAIDLGRDSPDPSPELPPDYLLSTILLSAFAALSPVGAVFGGLFGGWVADRWGRKCSLMFCGVPYLTGYLTISYAHYLPTAVIFKTLLLVGRFITGLGLGWASAISAVYIGEVSSAKLRGLFGSCVEFSLVLGVICTYALGSIDGFYYYYVSLVFAGIVALFEVIMVWLPETPRWLLSRGYKEDAEKVLLWLRGPAVDIEKELKEIKDNIVLIRKEKASLCKSFCQRSIFIPTIYVLIIFAFAELSGIDIISTFAEIIFLEANVPYPHIAPIYAITVPNFLGILIAIFIVDLVGRKPLLIFSGLTMSLGTGMLGVHFFITRPSLCDSHHSDNSTIISIGTTDSSSDVEIDSCNAQYGPLAIVSLIIYNFAFSIGWGPVHWLLLSELLPLSVRGAASGLASIVSNILSALTMGVYLQYAELVRQWFAMWTLLVINLLSSVFVLVFIPETKQESLEEIEKHFKKRPIIMETAL